MKKKLLYAILAVITVIAACNEEEDLIFEKKSEDRYPVIVSNTTFTPTIPATGFPVNSVIKVEFNYLQTDPIQEIQFLQKIGTADSTVISKTLYMPSFSKSKQCDTLLYDYVVPSAAPVGTTVVVRGRVVNKNGLYKDRSFSYKVK